MTKKDILKVVKYAGDNKEINQSTIRIKDLLTAIPENADLGAMTSVTHFIEDGSFGIFNYCDTRLDLDEDKKEIRSKIVNNLESIRIEINSWIEDADPFGTKGEVKAKKLKVKTSSIILLVTGVVLAILGIVLPFITKVNEETLHFSIESVKDIASIVADFFGVATVAVGGGIATKSSDKKTCFIIGIFLTALGGLGIIAIVPLACLIQFNGAKIYYTVCILISFAFVVLGAVFILCTPKKEKDFKEVQK